MDPEECRTNAREFYQAARKIVDPEVRRELLLLVVKWHKLANMITKERHKLH